jgi:Protein of unknown function (DUF3987)
MDGFDLSGGAKLHADRFRRLAAKGYLPDLLPILPYNIAPGDMSPHSRISVERLGKIPGDKTGFGWRGFPDWADHVTTEADLTTWEAFEPAPGVGIVSRRVVGYDIDVDDPALAQACWRAIFDIVGELPCRIGRAPHFLLMAKGSYDSRNFKFTNSEGRTQGFDIKGIRGQFLVDAIHAGTGQPYQWGPDIGAIADGFASDGPPPFDDLRAITPEEHDGIIAAIVATLAEAGYSTKSEVTRAGPDDSEYEPRRAVAGFVPDQPHHIAAVAEYLRHAPASVEGMGGDLNAYNVACHVRELGVTEHVGLDLARVHFLPRCEPGGDDWFQEKFASAYKNGENDLGADAPESIAWRAAEHTRKVRKEFAADGGWALDIASGNGPSAASKDGPRFSKFYSLHDEIPEPIMPDGAFPARVQEFIETEAAIKGSSTLPFIVPAITVAAAALHTEFKVRHSDSDTWLERPIIWGVTAGNVSEMKSVTQEPFVRPLHGLDAANRRSFKAQQDEYEKSHAGYLERLKEQEQAAKDGLLFPDEFWDGHMEGEMNLPPHRDHLILGPGSTSEGVRDLLKLNWGRGVLIHSDELLHEIAGMDTYRSDGNKGLDRAFYDAAWNGRDVSGSIARAGGKLIGMRNVYVSILGTIQYDVLADLQKARGVKLTSDGFLQRFLWGPSEASYHPQRGKRSNRNWRPMLERIIPEHWSMQAGYPGYIDTSSASRALFELFDEDMRREIVAHRDQSALASWMGKLSIYFPRIALALHAMRFGCGFDQHIPLMIYDEDIEATYRLLWEFFLPAGMQFFQRAFPSSPNRGIAERISDFLIAHPELETVGRDEILSHVRAVRRADQRGLFEDAMQILVNNGNVCETAWLANGRAIRWAVNPELHQHETMRRERNAQLAVKAKIAEQATARAAEARAARLAEMSAKVKASAL